MKIPFKIEKVTSFDPNRLSNAIRVQDTLAYGLELIEKGAREAPDGVMVSGYTLEDLKKNFTLGAKFYLGMHAEKDLCGGFLHAVSSSSFSPKMKMATLSWLTEDVLRLNEILSRGHYIYLDQIGVLRDYHKSGLAYQLLNQFEQDHAGEDVIVMVMTDPIDNVRSTDFFKRNEYQPFAQIHFPRFGIVKDFKGILLHKSL